MRVPAVSRAAPIATGVVVLIAGVLQFTAWKKRQLAVLPRRAAARAPGRRRHRLAPRPAARTLSFALLCRPDRSAACHRRHGPARNGGRDSPHCCRTPRARR